ncbi:MAG: Xaa-Pro aminopeptidase [Pseudomonadota bacterium]|nr:Xaa-Pro aminopeptidase [Pseudomonadota bacterium]
MAPLHPTSFAPAEFARRRQQLMAAMEPGAIAIVPSAPPQRRNSDTEYPYRQSSDFHYLTGFTEPNALLVLAPGREEGEYLLLCRPRNPEREQWDGVRVGPERAPEVLGCDQAFTIDEADALLPRILSGRTAVYCTLGASAEFDQRLVRWLDQVRATTRSGAEPPSRIIALEQSLHEMRLVKSTAEQTQMRRAGAISAEAHRRAMAACRPGMVEYQLEAELLYAFNLEGARAPAYPSIVGSGPNSCILHHVENNRRMEDGDLVLIDAGCELDHYAADITRTFPVNGKFSGEQAAIYEIVLAAQHAAFEAIRPGSAWNAAHDRTVEVITAGLLDLGLLQGEPNELIEREAYKPFYMHRAGHWLGMDVHDVGRYKQSGDWRTLQAGMALTVEPGIYIAAHLEGIDPRWHNIGVRIEDDVIVNGSGHDIITENAPKTIDDIEHWMASAR